MALEAEETVSSTTVFEGTRVTVRVDRIRFAGGAEGRREIVQGPDCAVVVAVDAQMRVLLVRQFRSAVGVELLELPAGGIDAGESPLQAAQRELREETGYAAAELRELGSYYASPGVLSEQMFAFLATGLSEASLPADDDEYIEVELLPFAQALELARAGGFHDAKTLAALLMAERPVLAMGGASA